MNHWFLVIIECKSNLFQYCWFSCICQLKKTKEPNRKETAIAKTSFASCSFRNVLQYPLNFSFFGWKLNQWTGSLSPSPLFHLLCISSVVLKTNLSSKYRDFSQIYKKCLIIANGSFKCTWCRVRISNFLHLKFRFWKRRGRGRKPFPGLHSKKLYL